MSIIIAILVLSIIILVHEWGHFIVAKIFKVPVKEFSLGMGKRIFSKIIGKTRYSIKLLPLGGSCAMVGEDIAGTGDLIENEGKIDTINNTIEYDGVVYDLDYVKKYNFENLKPIKKILICLAGPLFNFIFAIFLSIIIVSMIGIDRPIIADITEGGSATYASPYPLQAGDEILSIELPTGEKKYINLQRDISLFMAIYNDDILKNELPMLLNINRNGEKLTTALTPRYDETYDKAMIGIMLDGYKKCDNFIELIKYSFNEFYFYIDSTILSLKLLIDGKVPFSDISGPVGTVAVMGSSIDMARDYGIINAILSILTLTVLISANLGVMNLLPIPALDGGRILISLVEIILGRKINKKVETFLYAGSMLLLLLLMAYVFASDIFKLVN